MGVYNSPRPMCSLAIGIGRGLARQFKENLTIRQARCMHKGDPECEIVYRKVPNR
jgi:predicted hydrocarbon binding protein